MCVRYSCSQITHTGLPHAPDFRHQQRDPACSLACRPLRRAQQPDRHASADHRIWSPGRLSEGQGRRRRQRAGVNPQARSDARQSLHLGIRICLVHLIPRSHRPVCVSSSPCPRSRTTPDLQSLLPRLSDEMLTTTLFTCLISALSVAAQDVASDTNTQNGFTIHFPWCVALTDVSDGKVSHRDQRRAGHCRRAVPGPSLAVHFRRRDHDASIQLVHGSP